MCTNLQLIIFTSNYLVQYFYFNVCVCVCVKNKIDQWVNVITATTSGLILFLLNDNIFVFNSFNFYLKKYHQVNT